ncbi:P-loop NTPase fold protein [Mucilaginibacter sp. 44-25]|uniref:P-loop NTPase fold protein n=1 Tax=Mucilaginibacter sp. 44-25 TaxID=1895794 RepID=UPI000967BBBD|nr:P-loop NTPase fold protein [Mucilaginibacter sp. 44-25]OJW17436.1 MAG: hypothetical protein BGO48_07785 [Mucilaginibacter sp. 44-25]
MSYTVPISTESERFEEHLKQDGNKRLLFSAPFGAGKTFFLEEIFKAHKDYLTVTLQPTDYSVSSNTDVFELIKYDVLTQIFERFSDYLDLNETDFNDLLLAQSFVLNKLDFYNLAKSALKAFMPEAESLDSVKEGISKLIADYQNNKKDLTSTDEDAVVNYLVDIRMQRGSPREFDFFTAKIKEYLNKIRESSEKEVVLIIDDLDRLDAEHIFRIFNIFTAHNDSRFETNKFSFDKVILICDINTVENLFHHKYGEKAEFHGYIDKFYSQSIFFLTTRNF